MRESWICVDCNYTWEQTAPSPKKPCPICGSDRRAAEMSAEDTAQLHEEVSVRARHGMKGPYFWKAKAGDSFSHDTQKWVSRRYEIDREKNAYEEKIVDPETGDVIRHKCERLTDHRGRGSAKK